MTRTKATPLSAQLRSFLNKHDGEQRIFSAGSLAGEFEWTRGTLKATVGQIGKELKKAHAAGQIICFVDARGLPLREAEHFAPGSKSNNHPVIYAMPGTPSPQDGYRPGAHDEVNRLAAADDEDDKHDGDEHGGADGDGDGAGEEAAGEEQPEAPDLRERVREIKTAIACWRPDGPAPDWLTEAVLARLVSLPAAQVTWRQDLTSSRLPADRLTLLNAGVRRKGDFPPTSGAAQTLAAACRRDAAWFGRLVTAVHEHLDKKGPAVPDDELAAFVDDPEGWALDHADAPVELVVMTGLMAGADEEALADVAEVMADEPRVPSATVEEQLRGRLHEAQAAKEELSRQLRDALREAEKAGKVAERLRRELDELAAGSEEAADAQALADRRAAELARAHERVAALEADLESAREDAERAQEDAQAAAELPALREQLQGVRESLDAERRLRQAAEAREQEQAAKARSLARDLQQESGRALTLPVDDASAVLGALAGPVGQAARAAADRMASGAMQAADSQVLELAATYGRLAAGAAPAPAIQEPERQPEPEPAPAAEAPAEAVDAAPAAEQPPADQAEAAASGAQEAQPEDAPARADRTAAGLAAARRLPFTVTPLGGAEEVGGSALVVSTPDGTVLLDAGQRVRGEYGDPDLGQFHFSASGVHSLDAILVSHAHIDHVGSLPVLAQEYEPPIWMSAPTVDLATIMLRDSAKIQEARTNREMQIAELAESDLTEGGITRAAYEDHDVTEVMATVQVAQPDQAFLVPETDLIARFQPVDHVLGACAIHLKHRGTGKTLLYTGDLGPFTDPQLTLPGRNPIDTLHQADVVITESTYGQANAEMREGRRRMHVGRAQAVQLLKDHAEKAFERGGFVLLPTFSLGRTQELQRLLAGRDLPEAPIYMGGMGERITTVYSTWASKRDAGQWTSPGRFASGGGSINSVLRDHPGFQSAAEEILGEFQPGYLLVSPAMLSGGWSRAFLEMMVEDPRHAVLFTGYLPKHAGGIRNVDRVDTGRMLELPDRKLKVACDWKVLRGLSAHAPASDLRKFAEGMARGRRVAFGCVHGEPASQQELAAWIETGVTGATGQSLSRNTPWLPSLPA